MEQRIDLTTPLKTYIEVDNAVHNFITIIQSVVRNNYRTKIKNTQKERLYLLLEIRQLLQRKRRGRRTWQAIRYPSNRRTYDLLTNRLKNALDEQFTQNDNSLWRATKRILSHKPCSLPLLQENGTWTKTEE